MLQQNTVLMVSTTGKGDLQLRKVLNEAGMHVRLAESCAEARRVMASAAPPSIVFCDALLPDGTWADILTLATRGARQIPVIVVSRVVDIDLYINALEMGADDFIVPPFYRGDISHVLKCAMRKDGATETPAAV